jgi:hypothetical protein
MNMKKLITTMAAIAITTMTMAKGIYIVAGGDFRIPTATATIVATNSSPFMFAKNIYVKDEFSIKVKSMEETKYPKNTYTNFMLTCSEPGTYKVKIFDSNKKLWYFNFMDCKCIKEFKFPSYCNNNNVWSSTFQYSSIESVVLPPTITQIGSSMFNHCPNLKEFEIPDGVTSIGAAAFSWSGLERISLPDSVLSLGNSCFEACDVSLNGTTTSLLYVKLSNSITNIPKRCFNSSKHLETVILPTGLRTIGEQAFYSTSALNNLTFPTTIEFIDSEAFKSNASLTDINFRGTLEQYKNNAALVGAFGSVPEDATPTDNTILLNADGTYADGTYLSPRKTLHFNYVD